MRLGAALPPVAVGGGPLVADSISSTAKLLEELGYESLWVFDAVGRGFILPDPLTALAVAATVTTELELGTGVLQLPIRNVVDVAHRVMSLHLLAGDRLLLGVGPGSTDRDFKTFGGDFSGRFARFEEQWAQLRQWLAEEGVGDSTLSPWPAVAGGPTLMLAGWRGMWVERSATEASGWIASAANADDATLADAIARYRDAGGERAIVTNVQVSDNVGATIDRLGYLSDLGFDDAVVMDTRASRDRYARVRRSISS